MVSLNSIGVSSFRCLSCLTRIAIYTIYHLPFMYHLCTIYHLPIYTITALEYAEMVSSVLLSPCCEVGDVGDGEMKVEIQVRVQVKVKVQMQGLHWGMDQRELTDDWEREAWNAL